MGRWRLGVPVALGAAGLTAFLCALGSATAGQQEPPAPAPTHETFVVQPFDNVKKVRALEYMQTGAPALIAERLATYGPLRFVGGPGIFPRQGATTPAARWVVTGQVERGSDWKVAVTVRIASAEGVQSAAAARIGPKDEAPRLTLEAALEAFGSLPGMKLPPSGEPVLAPFSRDPYAFVLYGRGLGAYLAAKGTKTDRAVDVLKRSLVIDPRVPEVRRVLGHVHLEAGRPGHARAMWVYALDVRPTYVSALAGLAALDRTAGLPSARERYGRLVELDPDDLDARRAYGELLSEAGKLDEAQKQLEKVLEVTPGDLRARRALALVLAARRAGDELAAELEHIVKLDPEDLDARLDLAAAYMAVGRGTDAEAVYDEVLRRRPRNAAALKLVADLAQARGDLKKATAAYGKLRAISPQDPRPVFLLGAAQFAAGDLEGAERLFTEGARYPGMQGDAYSNLGAIALRRGEPKQALWFLSRAVKRRPGKANVRYNHAVALYSANRPADALNELHAASALDPSDAEARFFTGVVALRLGLLAEAEKSFREALRLDPKHERARHNLALLEPLVRPTRESSSVSFVEEPAPPPPPPAPAAE